jgi:hypothetical protein
MCVANWESKMTTKGNLTRGRIRIDAREQLQIMRLFRELLNEILSSDGGASDENGQTPSNEIGTILDSYTIDDNPDENKIEDYDLSRVADQSPLDVSSPSNSSINDVEVETGPGNITFYNSDITLDSHSKVLEEKYLLTKHFIIFKLIFSGYR